MSIIAAKGLKQISDSGEIEKIIDGVLAANAQQVADYRSGQGEGLQLAGRAGHEGVKRQSQSRAGERAAEAKARRALKLFFGGGRAGGGGRRG